jgi:alkyl sulfatase BDS1-like metallo-beta-lactamase superfamily hydrolase
MTLTQVFDYLAVRLDGPAAVAIGHHVWHWTLSDTGEAVTLELSNGVLHSRLGAPIEDVTASLTSTRRTLDQLAGTDLPLTAAVESGDVSLRGSSAEIVALWSHLSTFGMFFPIIEP